MVGVVLAIVSLGVGGVSYFSPQEIRAGMQIAAVAKKLAEEKSKESKPHGKTDSLSGK